MKTQCKITILKIYRCWNMANWGQQNIVCEGGIFLMKM